MGIIFIPAKDENTEEENDVTCKECGYSPVHYRDQCPSWCEDGYFDDSDGIFLKPGTNLIKCDECDGKGFLRWCPECGNSKHFCFQ